MVWSSTTDDFVSNTLYAFQNARLMPDAAYPVVSMYNVEAITTDLEQGRFVSYFPLEILCVYTLD
jgi:hypothetical protein